MKAVYSFIPRFCAWCGKALNIYADKYGREDWHSGASHSCDCGVHFAASTEEAILTASDVLGSDMRRYA